MYYIAGFSSITDSFHSKPPLAASKSAIAFIYIYGASYVSLSDLERQSEDNADYTVRWVVFCFYHRRGNLPQQSPDLLYDMDYGIPLDW